MEGLSTEQGGAIKTRRWTMTDAACEEREGERWIYKSLITLQQTANNHGADKRQENGSAAIFVAAAKLIVFSFFLSFFLKKKTSRNKTSNSWKEIIFHNFFPQKKFNVQFIFVCNT